MMREFETFRTRTDALLAQLDAEGREQCTRRCSPHELYASEACNIF